MEQIRYNKNRGKKYDTGWIIIQCKNDSINIRLHSRLHADYICKLMTKISLNETNVIPIKIRG